MRTILAHAALAAFLGLAIIVGCAGNRKPDIQETPAAVTAATPETTRVPDTTANTLADLLKGPAQQASAPNWGWVKNEWINVRSKPTTKAEIVAKLQRGDKVKLIDHAGQWWQVELSDGTRAYIHDSLVFHEKYVEPWLAFKMGCRRADSSLSLIIAVERYDGRADAVYLTVADEWYDLSDDARAGITKAAYSYWLDCLTQNGHDTDHAAAIFRDDIGKDIIEVSGNPGKPSIRDLD